MTGRSIFGVRSTPSHWLATRNVLPCPQKEWSAVSLSKRRSSSAGNGLMETGRRISDNGKLLPNRMSPEKMSIDIGSFIMFSCHHVSWLVAMLAMYDFDSCIIALFWWRPCRRYGGGVFTPMLRAAPGACMGLRLCRTPCGVASRRNPFFRQRRSLAYHTSIVHFLVFPKRYFYCLFV